MNTEEFPLKKREISFRDKVWFSFEGNLYRNVTEISTVMESFPIKQDDFIIEIGGGGGRFTKIFTDAGAEVVVIDISRRSLEVNKENTGCHAVLADLCQLPFRESVFDKAASLSVFQYVPSELSRLQGLQEVGRVLKSQAIFVIEVFNYRIYDAVKAEGKDGYHRRVNPPLYRHRFDKEEFASFLRLVFPKILRTEPALVFHPLLDNTSIGENPLIVRIFQIFEKTFARGWLGRWTYAISGCIMCVCQNERKKDEMASN